MIKFFKAEKECMDICAEILQEELAIRKDPIKSKCILDKYRQKHTNVWKIRLCSSPKIR